MAEIGSYNKIQPHKPDQNTLELLIRANYFLEHAKSHAERNSDFDTMIAIHNLDDSIEYILRILFIHFEIEESRKDSILELWNSLNDYFKQNELPELPYKKNIDNIRKQRNLVQHVMCNPNSDVKRYVSIGEDFFEEVLSQYFLLTRKSLEISSIIENSNLHGLLVNAESSMKSGYYKSTILECRDAFDYARFLSSATYLEELDKYPAVSEAKEHGLVKLSYMLENIQNEIELRGYGIEIGRYYQFQKSVRTAESKTLSHPISKDEAESCYLFVTDFILRQQDSHQLEYQEAEPEFYTHMTFDDIDADEYFAKKGCFYGFEDDMASLFYVNSREKADHFKKTSAGDYLSQKSYWKQDGKDALTYSEYCYVKDAQVKKIANAPEIWRVFILYGTIPFAVEKTNSVNENDRKNLDDKDIVENLTFYDEIKDMMPIRSLESAKKINDIFKQNGVNPDDFYSPEYIDSIKKRRNE